MKNLPVSTILSSSTRLKEARVEGRGLFLCPLKGMLSPVSLPAGMALPLFTESRPAFLPRFIEKKFDKIRRKGIVLLTHGVVAQLGERLNGIQEVVSSILSSSTKKIQGLTGNCKSFFCCSIWAYKLPCPRVDLNQIVFNLSLYCSIFCGTVISEQRIFQKMIKFRKTEGCCHKVSIRPNNATSI